MSPEDVTKSLHEIRAAAGDPETQHGIEDALYLAVDPAYAAASKTTSQHVLDEYLRSRQRVGRSEATLRYVRVKAGALMGLLPKLAGDVTHPRMSGYVDARLKEGAMRTTIRKELGVLKAALKLAKKNGEWLGDPDSVIPDLDDDYEPRSRALGPWELVGLCSVLPAFRAAHVVWIVATGARWGESVRARVDDRVSAMRQYLRGTKTRLARRDVPLVGPAVSMVDWAEARAPGADGRMFAPWLNVRRDLAQACAKLGIPPVSPNDLRRTFGTWLRNAGVEPQLIGAAMGHTDSRMVERVHGRLTPEALGKLLEERTGEHGEAEKDGCPDGQREANGGAESSGLGGVRENRRSLQGDAAAGARGHQVFGAEGDPRSGGKATGMLTGGTGDFGGAPAALPARPEAEKHGQCGAQGRSRTADTRIFSPSLVCSACGLIVGDSSPPHVRSGGVWDANGPHPAAWRSLFCAPWVEAAARALLEVRS